MAKLFDLKLKEREWKSEREYMELNLCNISDIHNELSKTIDEKRLQNKLRKGDIIRIQGIKNRNEGKWIWNGTEPVFLLRDGNYDETGFLPMSFQVLRDGFELDHWYDTIENCWVWIHLNRFRDQILENVRKLCFTKCWMEFSFVKTWFQHQDKIYYLFVKPIADKDTYEEGKIHLKEVLSKNSPTLVEYGPCIDLKYFPLREAFRNRRNKTDVANQCIVLN